MRLWGNSFSILVQRYLIARFGIQGPVHLQKPALLLLPSGEFLLAVPVEGVPVVAALSDGWQVGQCGCAALVFPESLQSLLDFRGVVVGHFFIGTVL